MSADSIGVCLKCPRLETDSWEAVASFLFPKQNCKGRRSLIRFFVTETRLRRQVGKSDLTPRDFSIPSDSAQVWLIKFRRHSMQII